MGFYQIIVSKSGLAKIIYKYVKASISVFIQIFWTSLPRLFARTTLSSLHPQIVFYPQLANSPHPQSSFPIPAKPVSSFFPTVSFFLSRLFALFPSSAPCCLFPSFLPSLFSFSLLLSLSLGGR